MDIDVFISHHTDSSLNIVKAITNRLESMGVRCWYSGRDIHGGAYAGSIMEALTGCSIFLLVLNRPASESAHVLNELEIATLRLSKKENVTIVPFHIADKEISENARYYIQRHHWIDAMDPPMYQRIEELANHLTHLLGKESKVQESVAAYRLIGQLPQPRDVFFGREDVLAQIHSTFEAGNRVLFLEGIGGIGKSELAKQYALRHRSDYDHVVFLTYSGSLKRLVCNPSALMIEGLEQGKEERDEDFFQRKMQVLTTITDSRTLLIVDNFDVNSDPDMQSFVRGNYRVIFTTRNSHRDFKTLAVGSITDTAALLQIFEENYGCALAQEEKPALLELFRFVEYHTYAIELIAKQMDASFLDAEQMLHLLKNGSLRSDLVETVAGRDTQGTAFENICALFNTGNLTEEEKQVMMHLSLAGTEGVPAQRFKEWAQLESFEPVNQLVAKSWIRKETGRRLTLHPMVREVVHHTLCPTTENCHSYLWEMYSFCYGAWYRKYHENLEAADAVEATLVYFRQLRGEDYLMFQSFCNFLWQVGRFESSVHHIHRVYDACVRDLGLNTMETGFVAKAVGGCYFNGRREQESIRWYRQGLESMLASNAPESDDLAMSYEKVARCYTWEYEQDFARAEELFEKALQIRFRLLERLDRGESLSMIEKTRVLNRNLLQNRIAQTYMEMGRMYQAKGDFETAYALAEKYIRLVEECSPDNVSGIAYGYYDCGVCCYHLAMQLRRQGDEATAARQLAAAEENLSKSLATNLKMRGALAVDTIDNQEYLADVYVAQGRYTEASDGYMAVLTMSENLLGKHHPRVQIVKDKMNFSHK